MQQYVTISQQLREEGTLQHLVEQSYLQLVERFPEWIKPNIDDAYRPLQEKAPISLADATHNDLYAIDIDDILPEARAIRSKGNTVRMRKVFDAYAIVKFSSDKKKEVLEEWEGMYGFNRKEPTPLKVTQLTQAETETVQWLLARISVPFNAPPEGFSESYASLVFRMRSAAAEHQPEWEQEQKTIEARYRVTRRG